MLSYLYTCDLTQKKTSTLYLPFIVDKIRKRQKSSPTLNGLQDIQRLIHNTEMCILYTPQI